MTPDLPPNLAKKTARISSAATQESPATKPYPFFDNSTRAKAFWLWPFVSEIDSIFAKVPDFCIMRRSPDASRQGYPTAPAMQ